MKIQITNFNFQGYFMEACNKLRHEPTTLIGRRRTQDLSNFRCILMLIGRYEFGLTPIAIAEFFNRDQGTVHQNCQKLLNKNNLNAFEVECMEACNKVYNEMYGKNFKQLKLVK